MLTYTNVNIYSSYISVLSYVAVSRSSVAGQVPVGFQSLTQKWQRSHVFCNKTAQSLCFTGKQNLSVFSKYNLYVSVKCHAYSPHLFIFVFGSTSWLWSPFSVPTCQLSMVVCKDSETSDARVVVYDSFI